MSDERGPRTTCRNNSTNKRQTQGCLISRYKHRSHHPFRRSPSVCEARTCRPGGRGSGSPAHPRAGRWAAGTKCLVPGWTQAAGSPWTRSEPRLLGGDDDIWHAPVFFLKFSGSQCDSSEDAAAGPASCGISPRSTGASAALGCAVFFPRSLRLQRTERAESAAGSFLRCRSRLSARRLRSGLGKSPQLTAGSSSLGLILFYRVRG